MNTAGSDARGELLLELLSEEIPARMQRRAIEDLTRLVREKLAAAEIPAATVEGWVTPRRLALVARGLPSTQPDHTEERRGPRVGSPPAALAGFLRAVGLPSADACERRDTGKGEFYFAVIRRPGRSTIAVLPEILHAAIAELPWPKSMRYPAASLRWVRPLTSIVCLFDGEVLPLALDRVPVGRTTRGHRFLSPGEIVVENADDYRARLGAADVVLDPDRRRETIRTGLDRLAAAEGLSVKPDEGLLDEVTGLVEYPVVLIGTIDAASMALPPEVLATAMRTHQKYFSCTTADGAAAPRFLFVANNRTPDSGRTIVGGNERVLRARLADARFFWDQDRKIPLENRVEALKSRVFHAKLRSVWHKVERVEKLAAFIATEIFAPSNVGNASSPSDTVMAGLDPAIHVFPTRPIDVDARVKPGHDEEGQEPLFLYGSAVLSRLAQRAAHLAKADLSTGMVGEFPELQGAMGRYYALHDGEEPEVADAIADHYKPLGPTDSCPTAPVSVVVALADKIDTLAAFFSIDEKPTGSRDPFAMRRAALGLIRIILENGLRLPLLTAFGEALQLPGAHLVANIEEAVARGIELLAFIADRLKVHLREQGVRHDHIAAVFELTGLSIVATTGRFEDDLVRLIARVHALAAFLAAEDGANLLVAYRRASNIVGIEERRDDRTYDGLVESALLRQPEEFALEGALVEAGERSARLLRDETFEEAMAALAQLRQPVDAFFDKVTVNTDEADLRENRLRLLSRIRATLNQVADFSRIEG